MTSTDDARNPDAHGDNATEESSADVFVEPIRRRSTYTPPPQYAKPAVVEEPAPVETPVVEDPAPVDHIPLPPVWGSASVSDVPEQSLPERSAPSTPEPAAYVPWNPEPFGDRSTWAAQPTPPAAPVEPERAPEIARPETARPEPELPESAVPEPATPEPDSPPRDSVREETGPHRFMTPDEEAATLARHAPPVGQPWIPQRRSLPDDELVDVLDAAGHQPGGTLSAMDALENEMRLREEEKQEYREWEDSMLAVGTPEALAAVAQVRPEFTSIVIPPELTPTAAIAIQSPAREQPEPPQQAVPTDTAALFGDPEFTPSTITGQNETAAAAVGEAVAEAAAAVQQTEPEEGPVFAGISAPSGFDEILAGGAPAEDAARDEARSGSDVDDINAFFAGLTGSVPVQTGPSTAEGEPASAAPTGPTRRARAGAASAGVAALSSHAATVRAPLFSVEQAGAVPTPELYRVGRASRLFWLWFAANSSVVSIGFGALVFSLGMSLRQSIMAILAGVALSFIPLGLGTLAGKRSGQPTVIVSRASFGLVGNIVPAALALVSRVFWGAVLLWLFASSIAGVLVSAGANGGLGYDSLVFLWLVLGVILAAAVAFFGYALFARVQLVVSVVSAVLIIGFVALTADRIDLATALTVVDGPWTLVVTGTVLVFSFVGLIWANSSSDLARYQRSGTTGATSMLWASFGTAVPTFLLIAYGALLAASDPGLAAGLVSQPIATLASILPSWYPLPLILATALSLLSGVVVIVYSGAFALQGVGLRLERQWSTVVAAILLLVLAAVFSLLTVDLTALFRDLATTLAVPVAAWVGIFAADTMIRNRHYHSTSMLRPGGLYPNVNWTNLGAFAAITVLGYGLTTATIGLLSWQGYLFALGGVPLDGPLAGSDLGVLVALLLGILTPIVSGIPAIRRQETAVL